MKVISMSKIMKSNEGKEKEFQLVIPLDASGVEDFKSEQAVKVLVQARDGSLESKTIKLNRRGRGSVTFSFPEKPGALNIILGPENASDEDLEGMQTIKMSVLARHWLDRPTLKLPAILIPAFYWHWWLRWCRTFTIRGRVICPDGRPVPGAEVCAYDTDLWWWWSSKEQVGCATTDATGAFEIKFRWCCGWWPWWWWRYRVWRLEPYLSERILPLLRRLPKIRKIPLPDPKPNLAIFEDLLLEDEFMPNPPQITQIKALARAKLEVKESGPAAAQEVLTPQKISINPSVLDGLRNQLLDRLPVVPELERLHLWPWWPWHPWWDCTPDIVFQVKQDCVEADTVIVDEGISDIRWNIPTNLNVTLVASNQACCIEPQDDPVGVCMVITHACDDQVQYIGGNPTASPTPAGYRNPGIIHYLGDRPFAGVIPIRGLFGDLANVDYYEFEWSNDGGVTWNDMPPAASGVLVRKYWGPALGGGPVKFHTVVFPFTNISGRRVVESREHFETNNDPISWGLTRFWTSGRDLLFRWLTRNNFTDGTYHLRVKSWNVHPSGNLINPRILPLCNTNNDNGIVLTIDNRIVGPGSGHPTTPNHPCGAGTIHVCTTEPDTDFLDVRINGVSVKPCDIIDATKGGTLEIDFMAHDPDGHLSYYTLHATYGENLVKNLLTVPIAVLIPGPGGAPVPVASQVGPSYAYARIQGAIAPTWNGGTLTLKIADLRQAFPVSCAYQLELRAYKRTIANCNDHLPYRNRSEFSITVQV